MKGVLSNGYSPVNLRTPTSEKIFSMLTEVSLQIYVHLVGTNAQKKVPKNPIFFKVATAPQSTENRYFGIKGPYPSKRTFLLIVRS